MSSSSSPDLPMSLDELESQWKTLVSHFKQPSLLLDPFNAVLALRPLKQAIDQLQQDTVRRGQAFRQKPPAYGYTEEGIMQAWETLLKRPEKQTDPKVLAILIRQTIDLPVMSLVENPALVTLIENNPAVFDSKPWLRRFYYFFFDTLYQQQPDAVLHLWGKVLVITARKVQAAARPNPLRPRYQSIVDIVAKCFSEQEGFLADRFEKYLAELLTQAPKEAKQTLEALTTYYRVALGFDSLPDGIRLYCQRYMFDDYLAQYIANPTDMVQLHQLLDQFCQLENRTGQDHFIRLVNEAFKDDLQAVLAAPKACIKAFLLDTIKDPRLNGQAWMSLKDHAPQTYNGLRFWFVEADFDFFFKFAFKGSYDDHARKDLWMKFLDQVHDFRVFLPEPSYRQFCDSVTDENKSAQVYLNQDPITGFLLCIHNLIIYEAVETGNAAYVYELTSLKSDHTWQAQSVKRFFNTLFNDNKAPNVGTRALVHPSLAPSQNEGGSSPSRRFTHDRNRMWHDQVLTFLARTHHIVPNPPKKKTG